MTAADSISRQKGNSSMFRDGYKVYLLILLLFILAFNYVDRFAVGVLLQSIKIDLNLTDTQLGLMTGIAFAVFYSIMGIPIARWADKGNRVTIISLSVATWSVMVALCGAVGSFAQLLLIRVGVGIGEAGCVPTANSLLADHFSRTERPRAAAIFALGGSVGVIAGYFLAGWLNRFYGWRVTFVLIGLPGLLLSVLAWMTLKDPRLSKANVASAAPVNIAQNTARAPDLATVAATLWKNLTFRHLVFSLSTVYFFLYGILQWQPSFFIRSYGLTTGAVGTWFALTYGASGLLGTYLGGEWASRFAAQNERLQLSGAALACLSLSVISPCAYLVPNIYLTFAILGFANFVVTTINAPLVATVQTIVPEPMRAMSFAIIFFFANLIGMGLGPLAAGALSDWLGRWYGQESLRYALLILSPGYCWAAWHFWRASRTVFGDLEVTSIPEVGGACASQVG